MARIVTLGAALQDVYLIDHNDFGTNSRGFLNQIELGAKIDIDRVKFSTGGGASNAATTFARNNHETIFLGCIANDPAGSAILTSFDEEGIDSSYITYVDNTQTGYSVLLLSPVGERTILTCRGASAKFNLLNPDDLDSIYPDWLYVTTLRGDFDTLEAFFTKAKSLGVKIMFNPGNLELAHPRKLLGLLKYVDVLLVNKSEAKKIVPGTVLTELISHLKNHLPAAIITAGYQGAIAANDEETYRIGLYESVKIKDSTGAGDAFGSGVCSALAHGKSFRDALIFGSANSTSVIQKIGSKTGIIGPNPRLHDMHIQEIR
ncbi:carbohydrate kinase family protein [Candidatus Saccharibacteria bacterium]|nr:carbohydrate kinase family protein [Candidatus Saccharibacteria bacterium]